MDKIFLLRLFAVMLFSCGFTQCKMTSEGEPNLEIESNKSTLDCPQKPTICPQIYMPAVCYAVMNGQQYSAEGSNTCEAKASLFAKLCKQTKTSSVIQNLQCKLTEK